MNNVFLKPSLLMGLLTAALNAQNLGKGGFEIRAFGGIVNAGGGPVRIIESAAGVQGAFGLSRFVAVTAGYTHDYSLDSFLIDCPSGATHIYLPGQTFIPKDCTNYGFQNEFMGGFRISAPNRSAITPHVEFSLGAVKQTAGDNFATGRTEFGFGPGAGLDYKLTRHLGIGVDANYVKANRLPGFYHVTGSVFFRF
jgi:hypothetical protein